MEKFDSIFIRRKFWNWFEFQTDQFMKNKKKLSSYFSSDFQLSRYKSSLIDLTWPWRDFDTRSVQQNTLVTQHEKTYFNINL